MNRRKRHPGRREETTRDHARAVLLALAVHVAGFGLLWLGSLSWTPRRPPEVAPAFTLVDAAPYLEAERREQVAEEQARAAAERLEREQREREQREQERQRQLQEQREAERRAEQERQAALERQRREQLEREAELARQAEQQQLERQRREAERRRLEELEELRRQREQAQREREEQERRLAEIAERREQERRRQEAEAEAERLRLAREQAQATERRATLRDEYIATIQELVRRNWIRPPTTNPGIECAVRVVQIPGGEIIDQTVASPCNADEATRRSIIAAVERAAVLPYRGYEDVFEREIRFVFRYDG